MTPRTMPKICPWSFVSCQLSLLRGRSRRFLLIAENLTDRLTDLPPAIRTRCPSRAGATSGKPLDKLSGYPKEKPPPEACGNRRGGQRGGTACRRSAAAPCRVVDPDASAAGEFRQRHS